MGVGRDGLIVLANTQVETLFGYAREELLGLAVEQLVPERFRDTHSSHRQGISPIPARGRWARVWSCSRAGGTVRSSPPRSACPVSRAATARLAIAAIRDISERVEEGRNRERLEAGGARATSRPAARGGAPGEPRTARGGIAHDFNNLLAVIINYAAFIAEDLDAASGIDGEEHWRGTRDDVEQIRLAGERASHLVHQLLCSHAGR